MTLRTHHDTTDPTAAGGDAAHTVGTLATRLAAAVAGARPALEAHGALLPPGTLAQSDALLAGLARHRVRIALYGEVKAGKSTLLNAIAGTPLSPVAFEPLTSIPVRVTYGEETVWCVGDRQLGSLAAVEAVMRSGSEPGAEVEVRTDFDLLELGGQVDLIDTPGLGSDTQFDAISSAVLRSLDAVVLVVRYPALFTEFTRHLMDELKADIGKLFVIWNLDADCAELTMEERGRHAETLRANVAGAHDLFLVDARAGFRAMQAEDAAGSIASGLSAFIAALRRFATSGDRQATALRQAGKRATKLLAAAHDTLARRQAAVDAAVQAAHGRINAVRATADAESASARDELTAADAAFTRAAEQATTKTGTLAADLRRRLYRARRRWVFRGDLRALEASVGDAAQCYAHAVDAAHGDASGAVLAAAAQVGATLPEATRPATQLALATLSPDDRAPLAVSGHAQSLRRAVWHRWYLPGLALLEGTALTEHLHTQAAWLAAHLGSARQAAAAALAARLDGISQRAAAEIERIRVESDCAANETVSAALRSDVPTLDEQAQIAARIAGDARALFVAARSDPARAASLKEAPAAGPDGPLPPSGSLRELPSPTDC